MTMSRATGSPAGATMSSAGIGLAAEAVALGGAFQEVAGGRQEGGRRLADREVGVGEDHGDAPAGGGELARLSGSGLRP